MKQQTLKIAIYAGETMEVPANYYGIFAVHKPVAAEGRTYSGYTISHAPSGLSMCKGFKRKKDAINALQTAIETLGDTVKEFDSEQFETLRSDKRLQAMAFFLYRARDIENDDRAENDDQLFEEAIDIFEYDLKTQDLLTQKGENA